MRVQPKAAATRASSEKKTHEASMKKWMLAFLMAALLLPTAFAQRLYDSSGRQIGRVDAERFYNASGQQIGRIDGERVYDSSGRQIGRIDGERLYSSSGSSMGRIDGERIYDASGRQIGRTDGLRRMQIIIWFYFFM